MSEPDVIAEIVKRFIDDVHTTLVGRVTRVNATTIDVQPVTKKVLNGSIIDMPLFSQVPPIFMQGGTSYEAHPITVGDYCLLFVCESSIERWYYGQDDMEPNEERKFDYSDAFAIVGVNPLSKAIPIPLVTTAVGDKIINGNYVHIGNLNLTGTITVIGDIILNGVSLDEFINDHTHGGVDTGPGNTAPPNPL